MGGPRAIDHLVIAVGDLDAAAHELEASVGLAVTAGGRHPGAGTANRLAFLADGAYLELIAVDDPAAARRGPVGTAALDILEHSGGGLATYALLDDTLETIVAELRANGSGIGPVTPGSRRRPDGELVQWWVAAHEQLGAERPPFLIRHAYAGAEWGAPALEERRSFAHPMGGPVVLARLDLATADPPSLAAAYARELGLELRAVSDLAVATIGVHTVRLVPRRELEVPAVVVLAAPIDAPRSVTLLGLRIDVEPVEVTAVLGARA